MPKNRSGRSIIYSKRLIDHAPDSARHGTIEMIYKTPHVNRYTQDEKIRTTWRDVSAVYKTRLSTPMKELRAMCLSHFHVENRVKVKLDWVIEPVAVGWRVRRMGFPDNREATGPEFNAWQIKSTQFSSAGMYFVAKYRINL